MIAVGAELARFACASRFEDLPVAVRHEGVRAFVNWIGCAAGGAQEESTRIAAGFASEFSAPGDAVVVGRGERLDMFAAAFVNGLSTSVHSYNDTHFETVAHPTSSVAAALLAAASRRPVSGRDFIHALILGIELQCRIGRIVTAAPARCAIGLSMVGLVGGIGAAIAVAKLHGLDEARMLAAIGIAANQSGGLREAHATMSSHFTPADGARGGLVAALLAERGFTCAPTMLEGPKGFGVSFGENPNYAAAVENLGSAYEIEKLAYKPYPCGFVIHPIIDACLAIRRGATFDPADVVAIDLTVSDVAAALTSRPTPRDRRQALVSFQHWAAATLLRDAAGLDEGSEEAVADPAIARLRGMVSFEVDPAMGREAARVCVKLADGRVLENAVAHCLGSEGRPMTDAELDEKFRGQAKLVWSPEKVDEIGAWGWGILEEPDMGAAARRLNA